jgi:hypothetical protein
VKNPAVAAEHAEANVAADARGAAVPGGAGDGGVVVAAGAAAVDAADGAMAVAGRGKNDAAAAAPGSHAVYGASVLPLAGARAAVHVGLVKGYLVGVAGGGAVVPAAAAAAAAVGPPARTAKVVCLKRYAADNNGGSAAASSRGGGNAILADAVDVLVAVVAALLDVSLQCHRHSASARRRPRCAFCHRPRCKCGVVVLEDGGWGGDMRISDEGSRARAHTRPHTDTHRGVCAPSGRGQA